MVQARGRVAAWIDEEFASDADEDRPVIYETSSTTDPTTRPVVYVLASSIDPPGVACPDGRTYSVSVIVATPLTAGEPAEDAVDVLVDRILDALDTHGVLWSEVRRGTFLDAYPCYTLTAEVPET